ncbi:hypothetical protein [Nitrospirillum iridis]|uniref:Uncharacterized protein n=1 Tax=Nitrospirillum iridis TaxID=765888 RepID=A0A7X0EDJ6_9PROT|nr:hypothetical protein [Nitrospirillum iridis]MBB6252165.1 hypothetical protein [Nitrospirillum iridis]
MSTPPIIWGNVSANGDIVSGSGNFLVSNTSGGHYNISFNTAFSQVPTVCGSQTMFGSSAEWPTDNVVFPFINNDSVTAITGLGTDGSQSNCSFSFIAIGF